MPYDNNGDGTYEALNQNNLFAYDGDGETRMAQYRGGMRGYDGRYYGGYDHHIHHHHHHYHHFDRDFYNILPFLFF